LAEADALRATQQRVTDYLRQHGLPLWAVAPSSVGGLAERGPREAPFQTEAFSLAVARDNLQAG